MSVELIDPSLNSSETFSSTWLLLLFSSEVSLDSFLLLYDLLISTDAEIVALFIEVLVKEWTLRFEIILFESKVDF